MSLLSDAQEECIILKRKLGKWLDLRCAFVATQKGTVLIVTQDKISFERGDCIKRNRDNKIFVILKDAIYIGGKCDFVHTEAKMMTTEEINDSLFTDKELEGNSVMKDIAIIDVLGTQYVVYESKMSTDNYMKQNGLSGYCDPFDRKVVIADVTEKDCFDLDSDDARRVYRNNLLRHEIIHAFLSESGLQENAMQCELPWPKNDEMVDWFTIQWPKINEAFKAVNALG